MWEIHELIKADCSAREFTKDVYLIGTKFSPTALDKIQKNYEDDLRQRQQEKEREAIEEQRRKQEELKKRVQVEEENRRRKEEELKEQIQIAEESKRKKSERLGKIKKDEQRQQLLLRIRAILETDFLSADQFYNEHCTTFVPP